ECHAKVTFGLILEGANLRCRGNIPNLHFLLLRTPAHHGESAPIGAVGHPQPEFRGRLRQRAKFLAAAKGPDAYHPVGAGGNKRPPVRWMKGHIGDSAAVAMEGPVFRAWLTVRWGGIPDADCLVGACRGELVTIGAERHAKDIINV